MVFLNFFPGLMRMSVYFTAQNGLLCYRSSLLEQFPEVAHGFFTRRGGASLGPYRSLNLSYTVGDLPEQVAANRASVQQALKLEALAGALQVHGGNYAIIGHSREAEAEVPEVDILITRQTGMGLLIKQADCQAVMLYDPACRIAANIHCGWRGQVQNILEEAVGLLREQCGCNPQDLYAVIGPGLGPCCAEFRHFQQEFPSQLWTYQVRPAYFDLWRLSRDQLAAAGLKPERVETIGVCTRCREDEFFSYRRDGTTGRQGAVIGLKPDRQEIGKVF